jgi:hypothetical protein
MTLQEQSSRKVNSRTGLANGLLRIALVALLIVILWHYFQSLDLSLVADRIRAGGLALLVILLPYGFIFLMESLAWQFTIGGPVRPGLGKLYLIRVATDALMYSIPGGVAVAEPMRPLLLQKKCGIGLTEGIGSCIITKINIAVAQFAYILLGFILVATFYPGVTLRLGVGNGFGGYLLVALSLLSAIGLLTLPFSGPRLTQLSRALARLPFAPVRKFILRVQPSIRQLDVQVGGFARDHTYRFVGSLLFAFTGWVLVALETYLILRFLGSEPTFTQAVALEGTASILRIVFFFLPAGIGASEVGFITLLLAFGFPDAVTLGAAYIAVKRLKEVAWMAFGYLIFWSAGLNPFGRVNARIQVTIPNPAVEMRTDEGCIPETCARTP